MCILYYHIVSIDIMLKGKNLFNYSNLFSPNEYEKNDETILQYFQLLKKVK